MGFDGSFIKLFDPKISFRPNFEKKFSAFRVNAFGEVQGTIVLFDTFEDFWFDNKGTCLFDRYSRCRYFGRSRGLVITASLSTIWQAGEQLNKQFNAIFGKSTDIFNST